jgi:chromate transporter
VEGAAPRLNPILLYFYLLKAVLLSFSGLSSLPVIHRDLVEDKKVITERQLNTAVAVARLGPGPLGLYVACIGYYAGGIPGAVAGCLAMMTPAFLIIPLLRWFGRRAENETVRRMIRAITLAAAGLLISAAAPLARDALVSPASVALAAVSFAVLVWTRIDTFWVVVGSALTGLAAYAARF